MATRDLRLVQGFELDRVAERVEDLETSHDLITDLRIDLAALKTTIKIWGTIIVIGTPLLGGFAAWLVLRNVPSIETQATQRAPKVAQTP